jgi:hypothetical protein
MELATKADVFARKTAERPENIGVETKLLAMK